MWNIYTGDGAKRRYSISEAERYNKLLVEISDTTIKVNGTTVKTNTKISPEITTTKSACIFGSPLVSLTTLGNLAEYMRLKIFSVEIADNENNVIMNLTPYQIGDRVGLLDTVSKIFFDGEFVNKPFVTKQSRMR